MSDLDRLLQQVEELKKLANRPDDSWMDNMSNEELQALGKRVRKVADGLSGLQGQLQRKTPSNPMKPLIPRRGAPQGAGSKARGAPQGAGSNKRAGTSGSLGSIVKRDQGSPPPAPQQANEGIDLSNPMQRANSVSLGLRSSCPPGHSTIGNWSVLTWKRSTSALASGSASGSRLSCG